MAHRGAGQCTRRLQSSSLKWLQLRCNSLYELPGYVCARLNTNCDTSSGPGARHGRFDRTRRQDERQAALQERARRRRRGGRRMRRRRMRQEPLEGVRKRRRAGGAAGATHSSVSRPCKASRATWRPPRCAGCTRTRRCSSFHDHRMSTLCHRPRLRCGGCQLLSTTGHRPAPSRIVVTQRGAGASELRSNFPRTGANKPT